MKIIKVILVIFLFISCHKKNREYVELTIGNSMNPVEPRTGILISDTDSVYISKETISHGERTGKYKYFKVSESVDFEKFKKSIIESFNDSIRFHSIPDNQPKQIVYLLNNKRYKQIFYYDQLSKKQKIAINNLLMLRKSQNLLQIPYYHFSDELLNYKLPDPPPPIR
ncbi:hypothetical protein [Chryseobacterium sp.]|uniref:hypothetical protein n=1 Tax=Chryseobacterium sp. TaxID=1871047 RepID=UPI002FC64768